MPIYEFRCNDCGHVFTEFFRQMSGANEGATPPCPECGSSATRRKLSSFSLGGPAGPDAQEVVAERAQSAKLASITPKEQIDKWRSAKSPTRS